MQSGVQTSRRDDMHISDNWGAGHRGVIRPGTIGVQLEATKVEKEITACRIGKLEVVP